MALCALAGVVGLTACGDDEESASEPKKVQIEATGGGKNVTIKAPKTAEGGLVEVTFKNSAKDPQEAQLVRIEGGRTKEDLLKTLGTDGGPIPTWLAGGGGVGQTKAGQTRTVTQVLPAGKYFIVDSNVEGTPAVVPLTLEGGSDDGDLPETDATITAKEYSFSANGLKPGRNEIQFANEGKELHHVLALPLKKGATLEDVKKSLTEEDSSGPVPFDESKSDGTAVIDSGESQVAELNLQQGKNVLVCFIQDRKGGPPHTNKGMITETEVR